VTSSINLARLIERYFTGRVMRQRKPGYVPASSHVCTGVELTLALDDLDAPFALAGLPPQVIPMMPEQAQAIPENLQGLLGDKRAAAESAQPFYSGALPCDDLASFDHVPFGQFYVLVHVAVSIICASLARASPNWAVSRSDDLSVGSPRLVARSRHSAANP
jgi:hypothetical protein